MNNHQLTMRRDSIADMGAVIRNAEAVAPALTDDFTSDIIIRLVLEIIHDQESKSSLINIGDFHTEKSIFGCTQRVQTRKSS